MSYTEAQKLYTTYGIDTEEAISKLTDKEVSIHCWQGDDVAGFDNPDG